MRGNRYLIGKSLRRGLTTRGSKIIFMGAGAAVRRKGKEGMEIVYTLIVVVVIQVCTVVKSHQRIPLKTNSKLYLKAD